ncbi:MAG: DUF4271 domain-containing protein [Bacteroidales bacterium]|nr:DUF4271 domain-containing protein [Bacteroidales bacterium]
MFDILALISTLIIITSLRKLTVIFPSLIGCMLRAKENINLEASVKHSIDRNICAVTMVIPFCLAAYRFGIYDITPLQSLDDSLRLAAYIGIFVLYVLLRLALAKMVRPGRLNKKTQSAADRISFTYFIIMTLAILGTGSVMAFCGMEPGLIKNAIIWISAAIYALMLLRKFQIFNSSCSVFAGFLYLCALEILPTGILIIPALIF